MNGNDQPVQLARVEEMPYYANENSIQHQVSFKVSIQPSKGISVVWSWLIIEEGNEDEDENVDDQAQREKDAIENVHSMPTLKWAVYSVHAIFTWVDAYEDFHNRLNQDPLNEAALVTEELDRKDEVELFYLNGIVDKDKLENVNHHKNY